MAKRLADTREMTLEDAKNIFADLAGARLRIEKRAAQTEVRIASLKAKMADANAVDDAAMADAEQRLTAYILAHPDEFRRPRQVATDFGKFGLRSAAEVHVDDADDVIEALMHLGYDDCLKVRRSLDKPAIKARLEGGCHIPGCEIRRGDLATYTVAKALVDEAKEVA